MSAATRGRSLAACRFLLAGVLLTTAVGKGLDLRGFAAVIADYRVLPGWALFPAGAALTLFELVLALWLLAGRRLRLAGLAALGLHLVFLGWAGLALARGLKIENCGCFGVFLARPLTPLTLVEDLALAGLCLAVVLLAPRESRAPGAAG